MSFDISQAWRTVQHMINAFIAALPRVVLALVVFVVFIGLAFAARNVVRRVAARHGGHQTLELALGRLAQSAMIVLGFLVAVTVAFPAFSPANLVSLLGVGSVAIGFAFKDIFQNFLAGLLILMTKPFRVGDEIVFREYEGTVQDIQTRATLIRTGDGKRVVIPNSDLYTNTVVVNTAYKTRRTTYDFRIAFGDDVERAKQVITDVLVRAEGVLPDPKADCVVVDIADTGVKLRARWWTDSRGDDRKGYVLEETKRRLDEAGIHIPYPTREVLLRGEDDADRQGGGDAGNGGRARGAAKPTESAAGPSNGAVRP